MKLIVGLGNPGESFADNRHNIGFMCIGHFARSQRIKFDRRQSRARIGTGTVAGVQVVVAKPQTFMNLSGEAVKLLVQKYKIDLDGLLVIHDDLDLPLGKLRIRKGGGSGGHNGVESVISALGSRDFARLRIGIGRPSLPPCSNEASENEVIAYVLSSFKPEEKLIVDAIMPRAAEAVLCILTDGLTAAMNKYNQK